MPKPQRPRDQNQLAKMIVDLATGEKSEQPQADEPAEDQAAVELGRRGGLKGGKARAAKLTPEQRSEAARRAARAGAVDRCPFGDENVAMEKPIPTFDDEFQSLGAAWPTVWQGEDVGCFYARKYFEDREVEVDPDLAPEIQRYEALRHYNSRGVGALIVPKNVRRNGKAFSLNGREYKVWKKPDPAFPFHGQLSFLKMSFFNQEWPQQVYPAYAIELPNRVIYYETDSGFNLVRLWLGLPKSADQEHIEFYWLEEVTFAMASSFTAPAVTNSAADEPDDLDFGWREDAAADGDLKEAR